MFNAPTFLLSALFWLVIAALAFWISWLVIRSAVLSALRAFARTPQVGRTTGFEREEG